MAPAWTAQRLDEISPELVLVCPDLRQAALANLPHRDPEAFLPASRTIRPSAPEYRLFESLGTDRPAQAARRPPQILLAVLTYAAQRALIVSIETTAAIALVIGGLALLAAVRV